MRRSMILATAIAIAFATTAFATESFADKDKKPKTLPPGLEKKIAKGKPLPPGWQKKLKVGRHLDLAVYRHGKVIVPIDKRGVITVSVDGRIVRLIEATREVVEILK